MRWETKFDLLNTGIEDASPPFGFFLIMNQTQTTTLHHGSKYFQIAKEMYSSKLGLP